MVSKKLKGLGRGLDALMGDPSAGDMLKTLPLDALQPGKYQPRTLMNDEALEELADSIRAQGLMQPVLVREIDIDRYEIIAGERRWRASQRAGLTEIPALVRVIADETALAMALIENIQRENLNPLEEAIGIQRLVDEFGLTQESAAQAVGKSRSSVANLLRLLNLTEPVREMLMAGHLDMGHARALLPLDTLQQIEAARLVVLKGLSVRDVEALVKKMQQEPVAAKEKAIDPDVLRLQESVSERIGARVIIQSGKKGSGKLTIEYGSLDQLDSLLSRL
ncbi:MULTISPECIES: ParB/RepB/Spo0J family partition protein [Deefgea]|uniref:ParB/RepB/Spo0J family partition protein n=1 Tax=Deefgea chitinilytica TaxID=570276 RepID=A0ABS2CE15_9NEIS|nr:MULTISPECIES: ParB/RepB/Spo0J family partition protein [Deefgea]MBM5572375.1 ParB/RepB/Spo0J family partition protein [Deefgea chitinilytica]MBM9889611.1 ParB/RepB/Spo0J family partition protein [Deefgea sp. CFH1-16]